MSELRFEEALKKLERIVEELEKGDLSLDLALKKYEEAIELSRQLSQKLKSVKKKIDILTKNKSGEFQLKPLEEQDLKP
ncbi:MAG: exodeoxyribonuclease VII small subunit [Candidatus Omnitrophica bacterium]|nr:exodeoxyribonuclease VII small subunit [Candidatus Omnitrophota bacterium]